MPGAAATFSGANALTLTGVVSGGGGDLTVNAAGGSLTFAGATANTYTGTTLVTAGTLNFAKTAAVAAVGGPLSISGGLVQETTNFNQLNTQPLFLSNNGTLALGTHSATVNYITFTNGGSITMTTGTLTVEQNIATFSTNGLPSTGFITGGTLASARGTGNQAVFNIASSGGAFATPIETINFTGVPTTGNFTLSFNSQTTSLIAYSTVSSALASNIQAALNALATIAAVGSVTVPTGTAASVAVDFTAAVPGAVLPQITANGVPINTVQTLSFSGDTGGTFQLSYSSQTTAPIAYSTTSSTLASSIQSALNRLSTLGAVNAVQTLTFAAGAGGTAPTGGTFTLAFNNGTTTATTGLITYSSTSATLQANILNAL